MYNLITALNEIAQINRGWAEISATTCIKFASREPQHQNYVYIQRGTNGTGCFSAVGMQGKVNYTNNQ